MAFKWKIGDLIDLEYFMGQDEGDTEADMARRDRRIFLDKVLPDLENNGSDQPINRRTALLLWLNARRKESVHKDMPSPGNAYHDLFTLLLVFAFLIAAGAGIGLAFAILQYNGKEPVNISSYIGVFVFFQLFLLLLLLLFSLFRKWLRLPRQHSIIRLLTGSIVSGIYARLITRPAQKISAAKRHQLKSLSGFVRGRSHIYGSVFYWPLFILAQTVGIGFNLGVLAGSAFKIMGTDLAFGWQSTIQLSSDAVYKLIEIMARPWSWLLPPGASHPSLSQVAGSRMVLKEGIYHLGTSDLVAWWPFLLLAVLVYGLLPRLILFAVGMAAQHKTMAGITFTHNSCDRLMRRMTTPVVESQGNTSSRDVIKKIYPDNRIAAKSNMEPLGNDAEAIGIISEDVADHFDHEEMEQILRTTLNITLNQTVQVLFDSQEDIRVFEALRRALSENTALHVVILQEAWQPPIEETLSYFRNMRSRLPKAIPIHILLTGRQQHRHYFSPVDPLEEKVWRQAVQTLGDPYMDVCSIRRSS